MIYFVDGNDLREALMSAERRRLSRPVAPLTRGEIARWLSRYAERRGCEVVLVFDENPVGSALPPTERHGRVRVVNLDPGARALHEISGPANRAAESDRVFVVTDDPKLADALRAGKARVIGSAEFAENARRMWGAGEDTADEEPDEKYSGLADEEVDYWLREFQGE